jgi:nucleoside-diphosphate-sugar epimerase
MIKFARKYRIVPDFRAKRTAAYSPISVNELSDFIAAVIKSPPQDNRVYTVCADESCTARDICRALKKQSRKYYCCLPFPAGLLRLLSILPLSFSNDQIDRLVMNKSDDNSSAREDYGFAPVSFLEYLSGDEKE